MFEGFKPTALERRAIDAGFRVVLDAARSEYEVLTQLKAEKRGYGRANDRVPEIAAKGLLAKWFRWGAEHPDEYLRDTYALRPAAIFAQGLGAWRSHEGKVTSEQFETLRLAYQAHESAFNRMMEATR